MKPAELNRALGKKEIPGLLFLHGEDRFSMEAAATRILDLVVSPQDRDFNFNRYDAKETDPQTVLDSAMTLPVFAARRLVWVRGAHQYSAAQLETFLAYLKEPVAETVLLFSGEKIDGRRKFFQIFKKEGALVEFKKPFDNQIPQFVREQARVLGLTLTEEALAEFCRRGGSNLQELHGELVKLKAYLGEKTLVEEPEVRDIVSDTRADSIFDLANAVGRGNRGEAVRLLGRILEEGLAPLLILSMLVRHFRQLWITMELLEQGADRRELASKVGVNPYFIDGLIAQARQMKASQLRRAFDLFLETDLALKSSGAHPAARLEMLVLELAGTGR